MKRGAHHGPSAEMVGTITARLQLAKLGMRAPPWTPDLVKTFSTRPDTSFPGVSQHSSKVESSFSVISITGIEILRGVGLGSEEVRVVGWNLTSSCCPVLLSHATFSWPRTNPRRISKPVSFS
jgi:hypothetical protein